MVFQKSIRWISRFSTVYELVLLVDLETKGISGGRNKKKQGRFSNKYIKMLN
jgi:hypothetical protein